MKEEMNKKQYYKFRHLWRLLLALDRDEYSDEAFSQKTKTLSNKQQDFIKETCIQAKKPLGLYYRLIIFKAKRKKQNLELILMEKKIEETQNKLLKKLQEHLFG